MVMSLKYQTTNWEMDLDPNFVRKKSTRVCTHTPTHYKPNPNNYVFFFKWKARCQNSNSSCFWVMRLHTTFLADLIFFSSFSSEYLQLEEKKCFFKKKTKLGLHWWSSS